jgi:sulfur carrier protein
VIAPEEKTILVNGEPQRTAAGTLAQLLEHLGFSATEVATAVNNEFVPRQDRARTPLAGDDKVEIVAARQGG